MLWSTPQGFLKAVRANHATITPTSEGTALSFVIAGNHTMTGVIDAQHRVVRVQTSSAPQPAMVGVTSQEVADGVFWLTGGTHHSLAIAMRDHIIVVDTPNGEARASAVLAKAKALIPGKPIRYVVAMHHHWDHLGGIRTAIDEGATIVTHETNRAFLERAATAPHTIHPDRLAMSKRDVQTIVPFHGARIVNLAEVKRRAGR